MKKVKKGNAGKKSLVKIAPLPASLRLVGSDGCHKMPGA